MHKILVIITAIIMTIIPANANQINRLLSSQHLNTGSISLSVKDVKTGNTVYSINETTPRNPASTLKLITSFAAYNTLGDDYNFYTRLYKTDKNELYLKLGGDPFLTSKDLDKLMSIAKSKNITEPKMFYIDSSIFDDSDWGEGWQWDDDLNPYMPRFSAYNIDGNLINIEITSRGKNIAPSITTKPYYPVTFMNMVKYGPVNNVKLERNNNIAPNIINATGTITTRQVLQIPVNNVKLYFNMRLEDAIKNAKIDYYKSFPQGVPPERKYLVGEINHEINQVMNSILKDSNNLAAESLYKIAGSFYSNETGTNENSTEMLEQYLKSIDLNYADIKIVDGSGVSKNNLMTSDFMTKFLIKQTECENFETLKGFMVTPGEGTLKNRMLYLKDSLWAKTGTLSDISAIAGYIKTRSGKLYAFDIMIQSAKTSNADKKNIEEQILRIIYAN